MTPIVLSLIYLFYLSLICQSLMIYDSLAYQALGNDLLHHGCVWFFQTGPQREPLYPLTVAASMHLAKVFSTDDSWILKLMQIGFLVLTQVLALTILRRLKVNRWITGLAVFYIGISPALVNSTIWVYSEIAALPLVLTVVLAAAHAWHKIFSPDPWWAQAMHGFVLGISLFLAVCVKDIFEAVAPFFMLAFIALFMAARRKRLYPVAQRALVVIMACAAAFYVPVTSYKTANKMLNGNFTFTDRGAWALYGMAAKRADPLKVSQIPPALAYIANPHFCYAVADKDSCDGWSYVRSDIYGMTRLHDIADQGVPKEKIYPLMVQQAFQKIAQHPLQYAFLSFLESLKMFFWETCRGGQATYPDWLEHIYNARGVEPAFIVVSSLASMCAFVYLLWYGWRHRQKLFHPSENDAQALAGFMVLMLTAYAFAHSFFFVLQRYALPMAPLWVIAIAFWVNNVSRPSAKARSCGTGVN